LYLQGKLNKEELIEKLNTEIWHFAKRQKTWFKRDKNIIWLDPRIISEKNKAIKEIKVFLRGKK
jgi:tRNA dimethylallyltransferase